MPSTDRAQIPLGDFLLERPVARGGTAEVWRARHRSSGLTVAVKVLGHGFAGELAQELALRNEIRAVAHLDHPHIVTVLDHGTIDEPAAQASGGALAPSSPYVVMEWASGGTLARATSTSWPELRSLLLTLLDALSHAHCRGVIHRDIKPANVIFCTESDARPGIKLADFGIARPRQGDNEAIAPVAGTITYMAPEQASGLAHLQGPATDLYALGCLAYRLATGAPPFQGTPEEVLAQHIQRAPAPPVCRFPAPEGFAEWVLRLLEKRTTDRFACAADAAFALGSLSTKLKPGAGAQPSTVAPERETETETVLYTLTMPLEGAAPVASRSPEGVPSRQEAPPIAETWRSLRPRPPRSMKLLASGLRLFGVRSVPFVDRESERDLLWATLREVARTGTSRCVLLHGPTGNGKSRLAEWLCERAMEVGAATVLRATHSAEGGPQDGIVAMLRRHFCCAGLERDEVGARLRAGLRSALPIEENDFAALVDLLAATDEGSPARRPRPPREQHELARRALHALTAARPLILFVEDVRFGIDATAFVRHLLAQQTRHPSPIAVLVTVDDEALVERPGEQAAVESLAKDPAAARLAVGPLPESHRLELVRELLGVEDDVAAMIERRAAGSPLYTVQLISGLVQRGLLLPTASGLTLADGATLSMPDDAHELWSSRVEQILAGASAAETEAVELAAVLGQEVNGREWAAACAFIGVNVPFGVLEALSDRRLATSTVHGFLFGHAMLREVIVRRAERAGRAARLHRACVAALQSSPDPGVEERIGRHALAAGDARLAALPLLRGAKRRHRAGEALSALEMLRERERALEHDAPSDIELRAEGWIEIAAIQAERGQVEDALEWGGRAELAARARGLHRILGHALVTRARIAQRQGRLVEAKAVVTEAFEAFTRVDDAYGLGLALHWLAIVCFEQGDAAGARVHQEHGLACFERAGEAWSAANAVYELGVIHRRLGDPGRAAELANRSLELYERAGARNGYANALISLGEIARDARDLERAESLYRRAAEIYDRIGSPNLYLAEVNLGLAFIAGRRFTEARKVLDEALEGLERTGWSSLLVCALVETLPCDAALCEWDAWDARMERFRALARDIEVADPDTAWAAELAGDLAREVAERERARAAYELAAAQFRAIGREADAERAGEKLRAL